MLKTRRFWIGLALIVVTLYLSFQGIQFDAVLAAFSRINLWYLLPAIVAFWLSYAPRASRWQLLFTPYKLRWGKVLATLCIGYFLSNITPLRVGDVVRAYLLANIERVPVPRALSSVVVERVSDALTIVLFFVVLIPFIPSVPEQVRSAAMLGGISGLALMFAFVLLSLQRGRALRLLKRVTAPIKYLQREGPWRALENLIDGFAVLHSARPLFGVIALSIGTWFFAAVMNWIFMFAMGIDLPLSAAALVLVGTSLAVTVAPTPGQVGVFHLAAVFILSTVYKISKADALAYAFVIHAYVYVWIMILGALFMWCEGLSYSKLQSVESRAATLN